MIVTAVLAALASAAMSYTLGYAVVAPRDSSLRSKRSMWILIAAALSIIPLPAQLPSLGAASGALEGIMPGLSLNWPNSISVGAYMTIWLSTSIGAFLVGMRIWNVGKADWRPGSGGSAFDSSASGRAAALIAMANNLDDVLDAMRRTAVDAKGVERIADEIRSAGRRFASQLPEESGAAYRFVVAKVPPACASNVTRYLLEGADRAGQIANIKRS